MVMTDPTRYLPVDAAMRHIYFVTGAERFKKKKKKRKKKTKTDNGRRGFEARVSSLAEIWTGTWGGRKVVPSERLCKEDIRIFGIFSYLTYTMQ